MYPNPLPPCSIPSGSIPAVLPVPTVPVCLTTKQGTLWQKSHIGCPALRLFSHFNKVQLSVGLAVYHVHRKVFRMQKNNVFQAVALQFFYSFLGQ